MKTKPGDAIEVPYKNTDILDFKGKVKRIENKLGIMKGKEFITLESLKSFRKLPVISGEELLQMELF